ncbi:MAG: hypothetical protein ACRCZE_02350 [Candidatus Altimarinota bacterium]
MTGKSKWEQFWKDCQNFLALMLLVVGLLVSAGLSEKAEAKPIPNGNQVEVVESESPLTWLLGAGILGLVLLGLRESGSAYADRCDRNKQLMMAKTLEKPGAHQRLPIRLRKLPKNFLK